jgi:uncharacterized YigZ family protein
MDSDNYKTIKSSSKGIYKAKGSRFLAFAFPVVNQEEIKPMIDSIRKEYHDARHHCYAYMIGSERLTWRLNDDGEPSGTAGRPILGQINSFGLTNILIVVSRYFGGTLLGVNGLINAYKAAAADALSNAEIIERTVHEYYEVRYPYISMNDTMRILKEENVDLSDQSYEVECSVVISFRVSAREKIISRLSRIKGLKYRFLESK